MVSVTVTTPLGYQHGIKARAGENEMTTIQDHGANMTTHAARCYALVLFTAVGNSSSLLALGRSIFLN